MQTALTLIAQLIPSLAAAPSADPASGADSMPSSGYTSPAAPLVGSGGLNWREIAESGAAGREDTARTRRRTKAVEYSGFYHARLTLHRWLSFTMIPLFVGSYITGDQVLKYSTDAPKWAINWHRPLATATAVVFTANTITGLWNLWDARKDPAGRAKRYIHSLLFMAADAGFAYSGITLARDARTSQQKRIQHRNIALASMGVSITSWGMMLFFK